MNRDVSEPVPFRRLDRVENDSQGKTVVDVTLRLEAGYGPTPARHVVSIETRDGATYRFQRYSRQEFLAFYNRENPDGSEFERKAPLPEHVEEVRRAIMKMVVVPDFEALRRAEIQVGERDPDGTDYEAHRHGESSLRAGYVTDGGEPNSHAERVNAMLRMDAENRGGDTE